jgi:DNA polymerase-3 subunit beta
MDFEVDKGALLEPLQLVIGVVERKQTVAVLGNLLVQATDSLCLTGTDQEVEVSSTIADVEVATEGEVTLPARKLLDICKSLKDGSRIRFRSEESRVAVTSGRFRSHLATLPVADFPNVELVGDAMRFSIPASELSGLVGQTGFAMAQQDVRFYFNGMLLEIEDGELRSVATNGQRLARSVMTSPGAGSGRFILPRKGVLEMSRLVQDAEGEVEMAFTDNHASFAAGNGRLITKLIDGTYPPYEQAIPSGGKQILIADRDELREALSRTAILSNEMYRNVRLRFAAGELVMHANNPMQEEAEETLAVEYDGDELEVGFNVVYLVDALSTMKGDRVRMTLTDSNIAAVLDDPDDGSCIYVISPMML